MLIPFVNFLCQRMKWNGRRRIIIHCNEMSMNIMNGARTMWRYSSTAHNVNKLVVYFGGDIQGTRESMQSHASTSQYDHWCYENTVEMLANQLPGHDIIVVKPDTMYKTVYSVYSSLVPSGDYGIPRYTTESTALPELMKLIWDKPTRESDHDYDHITLIGFSKGCIVLNQLMTELATTTTTNEPFWHRVTDIYWLDGGHGGRSGTWITDNTTVECMKTILHESSLHLRCTPYQMEDMNRPWIREECLVFQERLKHNHIPFDYTLLMGKVFGIQPTTNKHDYNIRPIGTMSTTRI